MKLKLFVVLFAFLGCARAQAIPDAASSPCDRATFSTRNGLIVWADGKPYSAGECEPLHVRTWEDANGSSARWYTYRFHWELPVLRTNKQLFKSKVFWISQAGLWVPMVIACRNPRSGEAFHSEVGAVAFMSGGLILTSKYMSEAYAPFVATYSAQHYLRADLR